jgi:hypothetical protein
MTTPDDNPDGDADYTSKDKTCVLCCHLVLSSGIVIWSCHLVLSSGVVILYCHLELSSGVVIWFCHLVLSSDIFTWYCHLGWHLGCHLCCQMDCIWCCHLGCYLDSHLTLSSEMTCYPLYLFIENFIHSVCWQSDFNGIADSVTISGLDNCF